MKKPNKLFKFNLRMKIAFLFILLVIMSLTAIGIVATLTQYQSLVDDTGKRLTSLAHYAASKIDGKDNFSGQENVQKELEQVIESANKLPISQIAEILRKDGKSAGKNLMAVYSYVMYMKDGKVYYGPDAFSDSERVTFNKPGTVVTNKNQIKNVEDIYSGIPYFASKPYKDNDGRWITGYARIFDSNDNIAGVICVDASIEFIYRKSQNLAIQILIFGAILIVLASFFSFYLANKITKPLILLKEGTNIIGNGNLDYTIDIKTNDEIEDLADEFNKMAKKLIEYTENLKKETSEKERIQSELKIGHKIQTSMLPGVFPPFPDRNEIAIYASMEPAKDVGGDFYDFFFIDKNKFCFLIGDVSGKGVPAALFMVKSKTLLKNQALLGLGTDKILNDVNNLLCMENEEMMFVTVFIGIVNTDTGEFQYSSAGHNPPLLAKKGFEFEYFRPVKNFVLAGMENFNYKSETIILEPASTVFIYTDGVTEAMNMKNEQFTEKRLESDLKSIDDKDEKGIICEIRDKIKLFVGEAPQSDDITMLVFKYNGGN